MGNAIPVNTCCRHNAEESESPARTCFFESVNVQDGLQAISDAA